MKGICARKGLRPIAAAAKQRYFLHLGQAPREQPRRRQQAARADDCAGQRGRYNTSVAITGVGDAVRAVIEAAQPNLEYLEFDRIRAGAVSDERAWHTEYREPRDITGLGVERNVLRYRPASVTIRLAEGESLAQLVRVVAAATRAGAPISISSATPLPTGLIALFGGQYSATTVDSVIVESDLRWNARVRAGELATTRIRLIGSDEVRFALASALDGNPEVAIYAGPVTTSGRLELLPFLREQSISITAHRLGNPDLGVATIVL